VRELVGDEGKLPTALKLGSLSRLALVELLNAFWSTSRSAGDGAKARKNDRLVDGEVTSTEPRPLGLRASNVEFAEVFPVSLEISKDGLSKRLNSLLFKEVVEANERVDCDGSSMFAAWQ